MLVWSIYDRPKSLEIYYKTIEQYIDNIKKIEDCLIGRLTYSSRCDVGFHVGHMRAFRATYKKLRVLNHEYERFLK